MNLDDLKSTWQSLHQVEENQLQKEDIRKLLRGKAKGTLYKIKRSIVLEGIVCLLFGGTFLLQKDWFYTPYSYEYMLAIVIFSICWYIFKYIRIAKVDLQNNLKSSLSSLVKALDTYLKVYLYGGIFVAITATFLPFIWSNKNTDTFFHGGIWVALGTLILTLPLYYFFLRWYLKKLYGNFVQELRNELEELQDLENE